MCRHSRGVEFWNSPPLGDKGDGDLVPKEKHPSWFKMKLERRQLIQELQPGCAVNVLLACWDFLETGRFPETLSPIEKIAASAFMPDLEDAWAKYSQRVENGSGGGAPKGNQNARKRKQPNGSVCPHTGANGTEEDFPKGKDSSNNRTGDAALVGGPPPRFYVDNITGKVIDRGEAWK